MEKTVERTPAQEKEEGLKLLKRIYSRIANDDDIALGHRLESINILVLCNHLVKGDKEMTQLQKTFFNLFRLSKKLRATIGQKEL